MRLRVQVLALLAGGSRFLVAFIALLPCCCDGFPVLPMPLLGKRWCKTSCKLQFDRGPGPEGPEFERAKHHQYCHGNLHTVKGLATIVII